MNKNRVHITDVRILKSYLLTLHEFSALKADQNVV